MSYYIAFTEGLVFSENPVQAGKTISSSRTVRNTGGLAPGEATSGCEGVSFGALGIYRLTLCADPGENGNGCGDSATGTLTILPS
jgi:hypothetical protein